MRVTRCHVAMPLAAGTEVVLPEDAAGHLVRVLRLRPDDACVLFNGDGHDYPARLLRADKREVRAQVLAAHAVASESPLRMELLQGVARGEKMDLILQKATELGVAAFHPVMAERTEVRLDGERLDKRMAHWHSVVTAACEQCGRAVVPALTPVQPLEPRLAALASDSLRLMLDPGGPQSLQALSVPHGQPVVIGIGPEGGWSPRDRTRLQQAGFIGLRLGPRVLRTETAGLAAIAALQALHGDI